MRISWPRCRRLLAVLWFSGAGILFFVVLLQTILKPATERAIETWEWFLPTIMPTLSLIIGALAVDALRKGTGTQTVDRFFFWLSFTLSLVYLVAVALMIFMQPFSSLPPGELMDQSNLWLGPFQGLVSAALGVFFMKKE